MAHLRCRNRGTYRKIHTFTKLIAGKLNQLGQLHSPTVPKLLLSLQLQVLPQRQECGDGRDVKTFHQEKILGPQQTQPHRLKIPLVHLQWLKGEETAQLPKKKRCLNPMKSIGHYVCTQSWVMFVATVTRTASCKLQPKCNGVVIPHFQDENTKSGRNGFRVRVPQALLAALDATGAGQMHQSSIKCDGTSNDMPAAVAPHPGIEGLRAPRPGLTSWTGFIMNDTWAI